MAVYYGDTQCGHCCTLWWHSNGMLVRVELNCALSSDMAVTLNMTVFMYFGDSQRCRVYLLWWWSCVVCAISRHGKLSQRVHVCALNLVIQLCCILLSSDMAIALNTAMFEQNGRCGYVLKPTVMWERSHVMYNHFNPWDKEFDGLHATIFTLHVRPMSLKWCLPSVSDCLSLYPLMQSVSMFLFICLFRVCVCVCVCVWVHACMRACVRACMHACMCACMCFRVLACMWERVRGGRERERKKRERVLVYI